MNRKILIRSIPYLLLAFFFDKIARLIRLSEEKELIFRIIHAVSNLKEAFATPFPSFHPYDLLAGAAFALAIRLAVYLKGKNAKKYRQGEEYGSARWGTAEDIRPYIDKDPDNNIIFTATESLTMNSRPKNPKHARNKNVTCIGGSGSGKTRFYVKGQILQLHSSYVVTDPNGLVC